VLPFALLTAGATAVLLLAHRSASAVGVWVAKPLASAGFVLAALAAGALDTTYGCWILAGLVLSACGDVLLIPRDSTTAFRAGLGSFLLGHVAYTGAFALRGLDVVTWALALAAVLIPSLVALRYLQPHLPPRMRAPVVAYLIVISVMVVCAAATVGHAGNAVILVGALAFYLSDLAVARDRFVAREFTNKAWGLPLYFGAQLALASTVAT
jgi:uncharacterized membrane protein YhhN